VDARIQPAMLAQGAPANESANETLLSGIFKSMAGSFQALRGKMNIKFPRTIKVTISHKLFEKLVAEHNLKEDPVASYAAIGKLIEAYQKGLKNINLKLKGEN
jgi:hypothetical protein